MDHYLPPFSLLLLVLAALVAASHGASPSEEYWHQVLPKTPMPRAIADSLPVDDKMGGVSVDVGSGGVHVGVDVRNGSHKAGTTVDVGNSGVHVHAGEGQPNSGTTIGVGRKYARERTGRRANGGGHGIAVKAGRPQKKPVSVRVNPQRNQFRYNYAASEDQLHDDRKVAIFFLEKDLHSGAKMNLQFTKTTPGSTFLPRSVADKTPLSSSKLPDILNQHSIKPGSPEAKTIKDTLDICTTPASNGENKYCATSMESMVDFTTSKLGSNVLILTTEVPRGSPRQEYTIGSGLQKMASPKSVACHSESYMYAVYYCHETPATIAYAVPLVGKDGTHVKAVAVCHKDTSAWNPKHLAFQLLKVKPGTVPVCHFLPQDHMVWVQK